MIRGLHFLLTYECTYECDHCFLYSGPLSEGTFTLAQIVGALQGAAELEGVESLSALPWPKVVRCCWPRPTGCPMLLLTPMPVIFVTACAGRCWNASPVA